MRLLITLTLQILKPLKTLWTIISLFIVSQMTNWPPYVPLSAKANVVYYMSDHCRQLKRDCRNAQKEKIKFVQKAN